MPGYSYVMTFGELIIAAVLALAVAVGFWMYRDWCRRKELEEMERNRLRSNRAVAKLMKQQENIGNRLANAAREVSSGVMVSTVGWYDISFLGAGKLVGINIDLTRPPENAIRFSSPGRCQWYLADEGSFSAIIRDIKSLAATQEVK